MSKESYEQYIDSSENTDIAFSPMSILTKTQLAVPNVYASSDKYSYHFGIDSINFSNIKVEENMCFISEDIEIGQLEEDEYIQLISDYNTGENGSIEFYVLDGSEPKSILPIGTNVVLDEKIFFGLRTRFSIDEDEPITIKKNNIVVDVTLDQAINSNEDGYTVSYTPIDAHDLTIKNDVVKLKVIIRTYSKNVDAPFVKRIAIKKYGRNSLWKDNIIK